MAYSLSYPDDEPGENTYQITLTISDISRSGALQIVNRMLDEIGYDTPTKTGRLRRPSDIAVTVAHVKAAGQ